MTDVRTASFAELDTSTLYAILRLRVDVFVVEQQCAYPELDGRDTESTTRHLWVGGDDGAVHAYIRVLDDGPALRIGRVVTARAARGRRLAEHLVLHAVERAGEREVVLDAQSYLRGWYERLGFAVAGEEFVEDGIPHLPMALRR